MTTTTSTQQRIGWQSAVIDSAHPSVDDNIYMSLTFLSGPVKGQSTGHMVAARGDEFARFLQALNIDPHTVVDLNECLRSMHDQFVSIFVREPKLHEGGYAQLPQVKGVRALHPNDQPGALVARNHIKSGTYKWKPPAEQSGRLLPRATPFAWRDPATLARRDWIYGKTLLRGAVTVTVGHGGSGKTILGITETTAMVSGRSLLGVQPERPMRVWYINLEETKEELERRFSATLRAYNLGPQDCGDRLLVDGNEMQLSIAQSSRDGTVMDDDMVNAIVDQLTFYSVDVLIIDPFVSSHAVSENDNMAIDAVAKRWAQIAAQTHCAVHLIHHSRKTGGEEVTVEDSRGASALVNKARIARELNPMSRQQAEEAGVEGEHWRYFFLRDGKANYAARNDAKEWYQFVSHTLPNAPNGQGDDVGVVARWEWPDTRLDLSAEQMEAVRAKIAGERCRRDHQAHAYVGKIVAEALGVDAADKQTMHGIKSLLRRWSKDGAVVEREGLTDKREVKIFVEIGNWSKAVCRT
jgi:KaiC/GvpD/RAD55 family RecA-like ATPase